MNTWARGAADRPEVADADELRPVRRDVDLGHRGGAAVPGAGDLLAHVGAGRSGDRVERGEPGLADATHGGERARDPQVATGETEVLDLAVVRGRLERGDRGAVGQRQLRERLGRLAVDRVEVTTHIDDLPSAEGRSASTIPSIWGRNVVLSAPVVALNAKMLGRLTGVVLPAASTWVKSPPITMVFPICTIDCTLPSTAEGVHDTGSGDTRRSWGVWTAQAGLVGTRTSPPTPSAVAINNSIRTNFLIGVPSVSSGVWPRSASEPAHDPFGASDVRPLRERRRPRR